MSTSLGNGLRAFAIDAKLESRPGIVDLDFTTASLAGAGGVGSVGSALACCTGTGWDVADCTAVVLGAGAWTIGGFGARENVLTTPVWGS